MGVKSLLFGLGVGAVAGLLLAPKKGSELREDIKDTYEKAKDLTKEDVIDVVNASYDRIVRAIEEFDLDGIKGTTKDKLSSLKVSVDELKEKAKNDENISQIIRKVTEVANNATTKINEYKERFANQQEAFDEAVNEVLDEVTDEIDQAIEEEE